MNYAKKGELLQFITKVGSFDEDSVAFYGGELLLALEHMHRLGIIHRLVDLHLWKSRIL